MNRRESGAPILTFRTETGRDFHFVRSPNRPHNYEESVKNRIFFKLLAVFLIVIAATAAILDVMLGSAWEASLRAEIERNLTQKTLLFAHRVETDRSPLPHRNRRAGRP